MKSGETCYIIKTCEQYLLKHSSSELGLARSSVLVLRSLSAEIARPGNACSQLLIITETKQTQADFFVSKRTRLINQMFGDFVELTLTQFRVIDRPFNESRHSVQMVTRYEC